MINKAAYVKIDDIGLVVEKEMEYSEWRYCPRNY